MAIKLGVTKLLETFHARFKGSSEVSIVTRFAACCLGLRPKICRPADNTEAFHHKREKNLWNKGYTRSFPRRDPRNDDRVR